MQTVTCDQMHCDGIFVVACCSSFIAHFTGRGRDIGLHLRHGTARHGRPAQLHRAADLVIFAASHAESTDIAEPAAVRGRRSTALSGMDRSL